MPLPDKLVFHRVLTSAHFKSPIEGSVPHERLHQHISQAELAHALPGGFGVSWSVGLIPYGAVRGCKAFDFIKSSLVDILGWQRVRQCLRCKVLARPRQGEKRTQRLTR